MKFLNVKQYSFGFLFISLIHQILGQRTIDTVQIGSNKYFFSDTSPYSPRLNWFLACQYCRNIGMDLLSFKTNEEFVDLSLYLENNGKSFNNYWTSGNQLGSDMWMWMTTGHPLNASFNYWAEGGPPLTKSAKGCMEVQNSVWSAANCMDNNAFICQLTRCYYFDYAVTNRINSNQGSISKDSNISEGNKRLSKLKDERTVATSPPANQNQGFKPLLNTVKLLQQRNFNSPPNVQHQQNQPQFSNPGNPERVPPSNQANEIVPKVPFLPQEIVPPLRSFEAASSPPPKNPAATGALNKNLGQLHRLKRKEEFSWAFA